ncbi:transcriptional regulator, putative [Theileria annulata]|uniref:Transcriptional regulator, putative n=1 Tax=Theileria annulata TaxID=5874 RepID=Q4UDR0_THEAN|nr:transcriptional regulator, putative [Theileria annulata]CAI74779.1 transcriptional regulator, putative [Theileria annulata]|eukprot:XP_952511.1 transcriptional regulator, putative [Theileria annulata]
MAQILLLKEEFPRAKAFRSTVFTLPLKSIFGRSKCILEITIPKEYPIERVSFRMLNPVPHYWSDGDLIRYPKELYEKPLVDVVWGVVSKFVDYDKYVSGKRLHEDEGEKKLVESFNKLKQNIVHALNNPPKTAITHLNSMSDDRVREVLESDSELFKLIFKCETLSEVVKLTKKRLNEGEERLSTSIRNMKKTENIFSDLEENIKYIKQISTGHTFNFSLDAKKTIGKTLKTEIEKLRKRIKNTKESVRSGKKRYKEVKDDLFELFKRANLLNILYLSLENEPD